MSRSIIEWLIFYWYFRKIKVTKQDLGIVIMRKQHGEAVLILPIGLTKFFVRHIFNLIYAEKFHWEQPWSLRANIT